MKAKKVVYIIGAVICSTLTIMFKTIALPVKLIGAALDAMAFTSDCANDQIVESIKGKE